MRKMVCCKHPDAPHNICWYIYIWGIQLAIERATTDNKHGEAGRMASAQYDSEGEAEKYRLD